MFLHCTFGYYRFELAEDCADDDDDRSAIRKLRKRVVKKLQMHDTLVRVCSPLLSLSLPHSFIFIFAYFIYVSTNFIIFVCLFLLISRFKLVAKTLEA